MIDTPFSDKSKHTDSNGCFDTEKNIGTSCRHQGPMLPPGRMYYDGNFTFDVTSKGGIVTHDDEGRKIEITAGGPGSDKGLCCGITTTIATDRDTGEKYFQIAAEDWLHKDALDHGKMMLLCKGSDCGGNVFNTAYHRALPISI